MASAPEAIERFEATKLFVASAALTARRLRETAPELWPASGRGGGRNQPHVTPGHLRNFLLAQGAHLPIDAAAAVAALCDLPVTGSETLHQPDPAKHAPFLGASMALSNLAEDGWTLGETLDVWIDSMADPAMRGVMQQTVGHEWMLTLCAEPAFATVSHRVSDWIESVTFGHRAFGDRAQRHIALPFKALLLCGELWQDTREQLAQAKGAALPGAAPSRDDQDHASARTREATTPEIKCARVNAQALTMRGPGTSLKLLKDRPHGHPQSYARHPVTEPVG